MAESTGDFNEGVKLDRVDAINQIFAEFEFAYHNQFHKAFNSEESQIIAKKYWLASLENYSPLQIVHAAKQVIRSQDYLPSIAALVKACDQGLDLFGVTSPRQAYRSLFRALAEARLHLESRGSLSGGSGDRVVPAG